LVCGNGNGYTSAIMINTTSTFYGYSLGLIAFPTTLSSFLPLMSLYLMAEYGSCNNHQQQQWCAINLVFMTCISLLLPTSALSAKKLMGSLIFWSRIWCKTCQLTLRIHMRYWCASHELLLLWDCSDKAVNYLASTKEPHWSWQWKWPHVCYHDQHNKHFLCLLSGLHCISYHIIMLATADASVSSGRVWLMQQSSTSAMVCHQSCCYYLHLIVTTYISLKC
jgi:hypothetical protein